VADTPPLGSLVGIRSAARHALGDCWPTLAVRPRGTGRSGRGRSLKTDGIGEHTQKFWQIRIVPKRSVVEEPKACPNALADFTQVPPCSLWISTTLDNIFHTASDPCASRITYGPVSPVDTSHVCDFFHRVTTEGAPVSAVQARSRSPADEGQASSARPCTCATNSATPRPSIEVHKSLCAALGRAHPPQSQRGGDR